MEIRFLFPAKDELDESFEYYESQQVGLGKDFLEVVYRAVNRIKDNPSAWQRISQRARRCLLNRCPFGVTYQIREEEILIVPIAHLHRKPLYWKERR